MTTENHEQHKKYCLKRGYLYEKLNLKIDANYIEILNHYGYWMEALYNQIIQPISIEQESFVRVCREHLPPNTIFEKAYIQYLNEIEAEKIYLNELEKEGEDEKFL